MNVKRVTLRLLVALAVAFTLAHMLLTLRWRVCHDSPFMLYVAFLMDRYGAVPYRDIFDMNMPGTYFVNFLLAKTLGYSDIAARVFDLLYLSALTAVTYIWTRRIHSYIAWFSVIFVPLIYLSIGPTIALQREFLALLPFSCALAIVVNRHEEHQRREALAVGLLWGFCALIKPHLLIGTIPVIAFVAREWKGAERGRGVVLACVTGFIIPIGSTLIYLAGTRALGPFVDIVTGYLPLYARLSFDHTIITGSERFWYFVKFTIIGISRTFWIVPAVLGIVVLDRKPESRRFVPLLSGMLLAFAIYPAFSGQFWFYHWLPFRLTTVVCAGACLVPYGGNRTSIARTVLLVFAVFFIDIFLLGQARMVWGDFREWRAGTPVAVSSGVPDRIAAYLRANLRPGDTVQPLDWTGGVVHGMLIAEARLATRFMYDFHFYHHIDSPYIMGLRREFIEELEAAPPRFIIDVTKNKVVVRGDNTTSEFRALSGFIKERYRIAAEDPYFVIYERK